MPTIRKRITKKDIVYDIQVKIKEFATQKYIYKTTTWRPAENMHPKQEQKSRAKFAEQFEQTILKLYSASKIQPIKHNIKVAEYAQLWLERIHNDYSLSYYEMSIKSVEWICHYLGGYKVTDVTPYIIQSFYDELVKATYTTTTVYAKPALREVMNKKNIKYKDFRYTYKLNSGSLANALKGKNISLEYAQKMAVYLKLKSNQSSLLKTRQSYILLTQLTKLKGQPAAFLQWQNDRYLLSTTMLPQITFHTTYDLKELYVTLTTNKPNNF